MKPITDIAIVPRQPRWPVRLDPVAPPSLRKVVSDTTTSTTEPTMEPHTITDMEQRRSMAYHAAVRPLTGDEYALLKEDIAKRGIITPIIKDAAGNIVDGYHRNKIAEELGLTDIPVKQVDGTDAELRAMAIALNVARRQLTAEDRQELVAQLRVEGKSTRQIAEQLGVDQSTVVRDLAKASDATASVDRVTGKDGKARPARMTRKPKAKPEADLEPTNVFSLDLAGQRLAPVEEPKLATEEPEAAEPPKVATIDDLQTWIDLKPALPMSELFTALWDCCIGAERLDIYQLVISDEWRSSRPRTIDRQPQQNRP
jgi:ParB-like chromosome segregation protein Spo0J